jgi:hypothetical protein
MTQPTFGNRLTPLFRNAAAEAQDLADRNGTPVMIWRRDGWYTVCETPPELLDPDPALDGWQEHALVDPHEPSESCGF